MQPGPLGRSRRGADDETRRITEMVKKQEGDGGRRAERKEEKRGGGEAEKRVRGRRAASEGGEGGEESRRLRWRINQLEKEKLQLTSSCNQEVCRLQAESARLRASVERGEAQRAELQYQLTASRRDGERVAELSRDRRTLTERMAELQQTVGKLQKALRGARQAREEDQHALQQEVEERDRLIQSFSSENQRLHQLLQDQEEALGESERRMVEVQRERKEKEEENRRQAEELKVLMEREERSRREKELSDRNIEAERAAHLETKDSLEILQLQVRDLEAAVAAERSGQQEAQCSLQLLRAQFREVERERSAGTERALQRLQAEFTQCKSDMTVALETERKATSDLSERLEEEKKRHASTVSLLQQAAERQSGAEETFMNVMKRVRETLQQHSSSGEQAAQPAKHDGKQSPAEVLQQLTMTLNTYRTRLEDSNRQVQDQLLAAEKLQEENQLLQQLTSDQKRQADESHQASLRLEEEVTRLRQEGSDWSMQSRGLQEELQREKEERREEIQEITDGFNKESTAQLSLLHCLYQRLLAGCVLLRQPQSILGDFTWKELCDVISEQVDQLTSDLQKAKEKISHLQSVCDRKSVCVRELQRSQECVLSRLEESVRRREEAWSRQHTHTVRHLQSQLQGLLSRSRQESSSFFFACSLVCGALKHAHCCLSALREQKRLLSRRLEDRELLEEQVRRLADALRGEEDKEEEEGRGRRALRRWRRSVCAVLAINRWSSLSRRTTVLFQLDRGRGRICVGGDWSTATQKGPDEAQTDEAPEGVCARWLRSKRLSAIILSSMSDLQGALTNTGSSAPNVISAARSGLSRLLDHLLDQSASSISSVRAKEDPLSRATPRQPDLNTLVSALQQHFLLFSQRLHSAEVERRSLRLEVANLKRGLRHEKDQKVPSERFHSVCEELRQALNREQEAQTLIQEQSKQLQDRVDKMSSEDTETQHTLSQTTQALLDAQKEVGRRERSLRILGKHLSGLQKERRQQEERLQRAEEELGDAARRREGLIRWMKAAETSCKQVRERLVQSQHSPPSQPLPSPQEHLQLSGAESIMGAPEAAVCQSFLSVVSQLCHAYSSRIHRLQQEVSAHRSHVIALRSELQDACLRDNLAFVPVEEFPADVETFGPVPLSDLAKVPEISINSAPS
ncbi:coiled-coil domain-containing protein 171 isoform X2 [Kryptolebias marmoratus]|uniref:coiled-coil domain-containing protein 171 isoform X2 n=1 Tax=Kryptolebias marmoratus TaxID=37003 RepID=UPI0018ACAF5E|nr:coiled-coil domain-containing protein 171 isoform X2 [Kryptolebias marmoratus]